MQQAQLQEGRPLWSMIAEAAQLLEPDPHRAEQQIHAVLKLAPGEPHALQLLADVYRARGDLHGARKQLETLAVQLPSVAAVHFELGALLAETADWKPAARALSRVVELEPNHPQAWGLLGNALLRGGDAQGAANAYGRQFASSAMDLKTLEQVSALEASQSEIVEDVLHEYLSIYPTDLGALERLGKLYMRVGRYEGAEKLFRQALELAPAFRNARLGLISALHQQLRPEDETREIECLLADEPENLDYRMLKAMALSASGKIGEALHACEEMLNAEPDHPKVWLACAHTLRIAGRREDCVAAYRKALEHDPQLSEAWWGLANLKTFRFSSADARALGNSLAQRDLTPENREFLHFALGKALEDLRDYEAAFEQYRRGNALVRARNPYDVQEAVDGVCKEKRRFTPAFFAAHAGQGCPSTEPIFILGLPRSGSTLVEQILASHSSVEGAGELPSLIALIRGLEAKDTGESDREDVFRGENPRSLGEEYLERCRPYRKVGRRHFTDKMPSNFRHVGLIAAILPNAKIVDARRHPLDCCVSNFKQIFPFRAGPSYDVADIGRHYRAYVELLAHFDHVLPGRIHRVIYEDLVENPEKEIRRLLDYCELPFEEKCLRFYETARDIRTISSEQVRQPLYTGSIAQWRRFEPWLAPLKQALGPVLEAYPAVPAGF